MRHTCRWALVGVLLVAPIAAAEPDIPTRLPASLLDDVADNRLDNFDLLQAGLIASGVTDEAELAECQSHFDRLANELAERLSSETTTRDAATEVLRFLHQELLVGDYQSSCTEVHHAFKRGDFNCVSATLLYQCFCRRLGLDPIAVATTTHVRSRFVEEEMDVETTYVNWFEAVRNDPSLQLLRAKIQKTRELSDVELIGKIYYNRGVSLLETRQFAAAIEMLDTALKLDPVDEPAGENRRAALNNWALAECDAGRFAHAVELVQQGLQDYPDYPLFLANDLHIHQRWAMTLCTSRQFADAAQVLDQAHARRPQVALFDQGRFAVYRQWADDLFERDAYDEAWRLFQSSAASHDGRREAIAFQAESLSHAVDELVRTDRHTEATRIIQQGLLRLPENAALLSQQRRLTKADL